MIVLITTRGHDYTLKCIVDRKFGCATPPFRITRYERLFGAWRVPRATYVFADLERLAPWELRLAADLYRSMTAAGLRCLNDPARAMSRVELLTALHASGTNPFRVMRADSDPHPARFPVFLRAECDHQRVSAELYHNQNELDQALRKLRDAGTPLRGMLVIEQAAEPYSDSLWAKWGTWRIGDQMIVEHLAVDKKWFVKYGDPSKLTDAAIEDEHDAISTNRFAADIRKSFDAGGIEFGRADHAAFAGRHIVYEINTNPYLPWFMSDHRPRRKAAQLMARRHLAEALQAIDTSDRGWVYIGGTKVRRPIRWWRPGFVTPRRP